MKKEKRFSRYRGMSPPSESRTNSAEELLKQLAEIKPMSPEEKALLDVISARDSQMRYKDLVIKHMEHYYNRGRKFAEGSRPGRKDALSKEIERTYKSLLRKNNKKPLAKEVFTALKQGKVIQEIDREDKSIFWIDSKTIEKTTLYKNFLSRYTKIKKNTS